MEYSRENQRRNPGPNCNCDANFAFGQEGPVDFAVGNRYFPIVLDHIHYVIAKFAKVAGHCVFAVKVLTIYGELLFCRSFLQRFFVRHPDVGRQFRGAGVLLPIIANFALQPDAHGWRKIIAFHLPPTLARPLLC